MGASDGIGVSATAAGKAACPWRARLRAKEAKMSGRYREAANMTKRILKR
jgi:hypothetical protein